MSAPPERIARDGVRATLHRAAPRWGEARTMAVGRFSCEDPAAGAALLEDLAMRARAEGAQALIGPMDGDTWHAYRLVVESDGRPPFLMEPPCGPHDLAAFRAAGFEAIARYLSAAIPLGGPPDPGAPDPAGVAVEAWDGTAPEALLAQVHALSGEAFAANPFYRPIALDDFLALYRPVVPLLRPDLVLFARREGRLAGFLFGIPNYAEGPRPRAAILKTYASLAPGAGRALASAFHANAAASGFETAIHALIHDDALSATRSRQEGAEVFRRYALMGRRLV